MSLRREQSLGSVFRASAQVQIESEPVASVVGGSELEPSFRVRRASMVGSETTPRSLLRRASMPAIGTMPLLAELPSSAMSRASMIPFASAMPLRREMSWACRTDKMASIDNAIDNERLGQGGGRLALRASVVGDGTFPGSCMALRKRRMSYDGLGSVESFQAKVLLPLPYPTTPIPYPTLEATQGQILSQSPIDATRFWWHLYGS